MNITRFTSLVFRRGMGCTAQYNYFKAGCHTGNFQLLENNKKKNTQICHVSTCDVKTEDKKENLIAKIFNKIPFIGVNKTRIKGAAYLLYEEVADKVNYVSFFEQLDLPDTFYSWFVITELHIWMLSARAMAEGEEGRYLRNSLVEALWADVAQRVKKLGAGNPAGMREQVSELSEQLQAALVAYDEGLQSNDVVLAGALWRRFYHLETVDPECLEQLVKYVRKHITLLDNLSSDQIFKEKNINWQPLGK